MRKLLKFLLASALILFVGVPVAIVACVVLLGALGIAVGIGGAVIGLLFTLVTLALMIVLPVLLLWWIATRLFSRQRTY